MTANQEDDAGKPDSCESPDLTSGPASNERTTQPTGGCVASAARGSITGSLALLGWDVVLCGSFLLSILVCPVWFWVSILKNLIQRPGWRIAFFRISIPAVTFALAMGNESVQRRIAHAGAERIIRACEEFRAANGSYPAKLEDLVPAYLRSVPRAKYCLVQGEFSYWNFDDDSILVWCDVPPYGRPIYSFKKGTWGYLD